MPAVSNVFEGPVFVVRDNIDTDQIIPAQYLNLVPTIPEEYGGHGLGITEATLLLEEVARSGGAMNAASAIQHELRHRMKHAIHRNRIRQHEKIFFTRCLHSMTAL